MICNLQKLNCNYCIFPQLSWIQEKNDLGGNYTVVWQLCVAMMSWIRRWVELNWLFINRLRAFILFAENSQILLKMSVIPILNNNDNILQQSKALFQAYWRTAIHCTVGVKNLLHRGSNHWPLEYKASIFTIPPR